MFLSFISYQTPAGSIAMYFYNQVSFPPEVVIWTHETNNTGIKIKNIYTSAILWISVEQYNFRMNSRSFQQYVLFSAGHFKILLNFSIERFRGDPYKEFSRIINPLLGIFASQW